MLIKVFNIFSTFSGLKPNISKCEIASIGVLKGVKVVVCGMKCIDLSIDTIKVLGIHFSYNKKLELEKNFLRVVSKMQKPLRLWHFRNLTLEGRITIFKTLALSKLVYLALIITVPKRTINELQKIQKEFIWNYTTLKIKHETLCNSYDLGGLKNVDIIPKIDSLKCSWIKWLYNESFHEWKVITASFDRKNIW